MSKLALLGGSKAITKEAGDMFKWPIINQEMEDGTLQVLRECNMSGTDLTKKFERGFADWHGLEYGLAHSSGTAALQCAMYGVGLGVGDEMICPSVTYWASAVQALSLGAGVVFADIDHDTLCIDPNDIERHITPRTKAIMVVHYLSYPADMDAIMAIARKHDLKVIEDVSHAQGGLFKGQMLGTFGDVAAMSLMSGKSFAIGEGGIMITDNREIYERAIIFGHYERHSEVKDENLKPLIGIPHGGYKYRLHQMSSVVGLEQLKKYPAEMAEIDKAMNYFWDKLEGLPGIRSHRPAKDSGSTKSGWYASHGIYVAEELGGLSIGRFSEALAAEGATTCAAGCNRALHTHPLFYDVDVYGAGKPTATAGMPEGTDLRAITGALPESEIIQSRVFNIPWFKHFRPEIIDEYVEAFKKVIKNHKELLKDDKARQESGQWALTARKN